ncbi:AAA family ATPase [bacterium]|nr:AAA family ATPase [bacterium]
MTRAPDRASLPRAFGPKGRFQPLELVGEGSMGTVYRAHDSESGAVVALKTLRDLEAEQIFRLKGEFRALAGIVHANLVQLHDLFVTDDTCFFTMEFVDGVDFVEHVRGTTDGAPAAGWLTRFHAAAPQLLRGLAAVHAAGRLHRDVKPSNIRVTPDGRVVLLDFDLATALADDDGRMALASAVAGTFAYIAPEQLSSVQVGRASDLYSTGVVFFEAVTGRLPFVGSSAEIAMQKTATAAVPARHLAPEVPESVEALIGALLQREPSRRPPLDQVLADMPRPTHAAPDAPPSRPRELVGRDQELATLAALFDRAVAGGAAVASVHGTSGIGKTALVHRFTADLEVGGTTLVLRGRCHPQESVPYKALDPIIDALSRYLVALPDQEAAALLPRYGDALVRVFPVLSRAPAWATAARRREQLDALELRRRAFAAFRALLVNIAATRPLVVWIDDLQWGDVDSAALIGELLRPPDPPPVMLVLTYRSEERDGIPLLRVLEQLAGDPASPRVQQIEVGPLRDSAAQELASHLCPAASRSAAMLSRLTAQSGGSPFLLSALAWHFADADESAELPAVDLRDVIRARLDRLPAAQRRIVELVAVAGGPIDRSVVLDAARQGEPGRPLVARLETESLLRGTTLGERPGLEAYHDRIRESVVAELDAEARAQCHHDLARAFEASGRAEPEVLAQHFRGAGAMAKAADYAVAAADKAADALAFVRAAELYRQAREWDTRDANWTRVLLTREGDALANAARFFDGAQVLLAAADHAAPRDGINLRRRAAEHLLAAGRIDDGVHVLSAVLRELGLRYPRSQTGAMLGAAWHVARFALGGFAEQPDRANEPDALRAEACYSAGKGFVDIDPPRGVYFSLAALRHARRANDRVRLGCALSLVGGSLLVVGGSALARLGQRMVAQAQALECETGSALLRGIIDVSLGQVAMLQGRWKESIERSDAGVRVLVEACRGVAFECNIGRGIPLRSVEEIGDLTAVEQRSAELLQSGAVLRDRLAEAMGSQHMSTALLARDDVAGARLFPRRTWEAWSDKGFHLQHLYAIRQEAMCDLYDGDPRQAHARLLAAWPAARRAHLLRVSLARVDALSLRGRLALAVAQCGGDDALLRAAAADARGLRREGRGDATVHAAMLEAGVAATRGDAQEATARLAEVIAAAERHDMALHAAVARYRRAELRGANGGALRSAARDAIAARGIRVPERWAAMYAPGRWTSR